MANNQNNIYPQHPRTIYPVSAAQRSGEGGQPIHYQHQHQQYLNTVLNANGQVLSSVSVVPVPSQSAPSLEVGSQRGMSSSRPFPIRPVHQFAHMPVDMRPPPTNGVHGITVIPAISPGPYTIPPHVNADSVDMGYHSSDSREHGDGQEPLSPLQGFYVPR